MKLKELLKLVDFGSLKLLFYIDDEEDPIWDGIGWDVPWWLADLELASLDPEFNEEPVDYRDSLGEEYNNVPGVVICLKERGE